MESEMIKPSIGRIVWFTPASSDALLSGSNQPLAAIVTYVHSDRCVNLSVFDANGGMHARTSATLLQDDDVGNEAGYYAEWMPFQKTNPGAVDSANQNLQAQINSLRGQLILPANLSGVSEEARINATNVIPRGHFEAWDNAGYLTAVDKLARYLQTGDILSNSPATAEAKSTDKSASSVSRFTLETALRNGRQLIANQSPDYATISACFEALATDVESRLEAI